VVDPEQARSRLEPPGFEQDRPGAAAGIEHAQARSRRRQPGDGRGQRWVQAPRDRGQPVGAPVQRPGRAQPDHRAARLQVTRQDAQPSGGTRPPRRLWYGTPRAAASWSPTASSRSWRPSPRPRISSATTPSIPWTVRATRVTPGTGPTAAPGPGATPGHERPVVRRCMSMRSHAAARDGGHMPSRLAGEGPSLDPPAGS
jgi:hypothetical protein